MGACPLRLPGPPHTLPGLRLRRLPRRLGPHHPRAPTGLLRRQPLAWLRPRQPLLGADPIKHPVPSPPLAQGLHGPHQPFPVPLHPFRPPQRSRAPVQRPGPGTLGVVPQRLALGWRAADPPQGRGPLRGSAAVASGRGGWGRGTGRQRGCCRGSLTPAASGGGRGAGRRCRDGSGPTMPCVPRRSAR